MEKQKTEIVETLHKLNENMKDYSIDVESRLERAMKAGGTRDVAKKYGFEQMGAKNVAEYMADDRDEREYKDTQAFNRKLIKMHTEASKYMSKSSKAVSDKDSDTFSTTSLPKIESTRGPKRLPAMPDKTV